MPDYRRPIDFGAPVVTTLFFVIRLHRDRVLVERMVGRKFSIIISIR